MIIYWCGAGYDDSTDEEDDCGTDQDVGGEEKRRTKRRTKRW